jgi:hypothetical protein
LLLENIAQQIQQLMWWLVQPTAPAAIQTHLSGGIVLSVQKCASQKRADFGTFVPSIVGRLSTLSPSWHWVLTWNLKTRHLNLQKGCIETCCQNHEVNNSMYKSQLMTTLMVYASINLQY